MLALLSVMLALLSSMLALLSSMSALLSSMLALLVRISRIFKISTILIRFYGLGFKGNECQALFGLSSVSFRSPFGVVSQTVL